MKATLRNYRQSPRKVRLVADFVRGKNVDNALTSLKFLQKRASEPVKKLIESALANAAENHQLPDAERKQLYVKEIRVDDGIVFKRMMPRAMGRGAAIRKRTSHIMLTLGKKEKTSPKKAETKPEAQKSESSEKN